MNENENNVLENEEVTTSENDENEENGLEDQDGGQQNVNADSDSVESVIMTAEQAQTLVNGSLFQSFALATILGVLAFSLFAKGVNH